MLWYLKKKEDVPKKDDVLHFVFYIHMQMRAGNIAKSFKIDKRNFKTTGGNYDYC